MNFTLDNVINMVRSGGTMRFHTHYERTLKTQSVGAHTYNVLLITYALTRGELSRTAMLAALIHDSGEHWSGDLPAPTKRSLPREAVDAYEAFDQRLLREATGLSDDALQVSDAERLVIKIADAMEGALFCIRERQLGNTLASGMLQNFHEYYTKAVGEYFLKYQEARRVPLIDWSLYDALNTFIKEHL